MEKQADPQFQVVEEVAKELRALNASWFVCGGWAIDLFLGRKTREHQDVEIGIFRDQQQELVQLVDWKWQLVDRGAAKAWSGSWLDLPIHELRGFNARTNGTLEVLLNERDEVNWIYRRNPRVTLPLSKAVLVTAGGIIYLAPEIVLLYKTKNARPKDMEDRANVLPMLSAASKAWLEAAELQAGAVP